MKKQKLLLTFFSVILLFSSTAFVSAAKLGAPAPSLDYGLFSPGDIIMNSVKVPGAPTIQTYYETLGWNFGDEGGGYTGIQWTDEKVLTGGPVFIFSLWDPLKGNGAAINALYLDSGTVTRRFAGEGTGLNSMNWTLGWVPDEWYTIVVRRWDCGNGHTCFGHWVQKLSTGIWTHNITMDYPVPNVMFNGGPYTFLEDWAWNGMTRSVYYQNCWKRMANGSWAAGNRPLFNASDPTGTIPLGYDGKTIGDTFYLQSGQGTIASLSKVTYLPAISMSTAPTLTVGRLVDLNTTNLSGGDTIRIDWSTDATRSPQFAYRVRLHSLSDNVIVYDKETVNPHVRSATIPVSTTGQFTVELSIKDIFDQVSNSLTAVAGIPVCTMTISPSSQTFASTGGTGSITVTAPAGSCAWTASSSLSWVTITAGSSGTGSGTVTISVSANTSSSSRTGAITIAGQTFTITQSAAAQNNCAASVSSSLVVHIPIITYNGLNYWADLQYNSANSTLSVAGAGAISDMSPYSNCTASTISSDFKLHIPSLVFNGASYSVDLQWNGSVFVILGANVNNSTGNYTDNGNGTVTDSATGLTWQQGENAINDNWYKASGTYDATYNPSSQNVCGSLSIAGGGWRLPTKDELFGLVDTSFNPTINKTYFPNAYATIDNVYWTSTVTDSTFAWYVYFSDGTAGSKGYKKNTGYVRCVR